MCNNVSVVIYCYEDSTFLSIKEDSSLAICRKDTFPCDSETILSDSLLYLKYAKDFISNEVIPAILRADPLENNDKLMTDFCEHSLPIRAVKNEEVFIVLSVQLSLKSLLLKAYGSFMTFATNEQCINNSVLDLSEVVNIINVSINNTAKG